MTFYPYAFEGPIARHAFDRYAYTVLHLPEALAAAPPFSQTPRLRVEGEIAERPVAGAWQPYGGRLCFLLSQRFLREAALAVGDLVEMRFAVADQNAVEAPALLRRALEADPALLDQWSGLSAGVRRAFAHQVASAKREATQHKRVEAVLGMIARGERPGAQARTARDRRRC